MMDAVRTSLLCNVRLNELAFVLRSIVMALCAMLLL